MRHTVLLLGAVASAAAFAPGLAPKPAHRQHGTGYTAVTMQDSTLESKARRPLDIAALQPEPSSVEQSVKLNPVLFRQLDTDNSGTVDVAEFKAIFNQDMSHKWKGASGKPAEMDEAIRRLYTRADLNGDGVLDIGEFERLQNMQEHGDEAGGNVWAQTAIKLKLLKPNSPLADGEAAVLVGNKGFDPLGFATSLTTLKGYREAELKHGRLAMLAALGWPVSELLQPLLASKFGAPDLLAISSDGLAKAPSVLNGGLEKISPFFFMAVIIFTATVEAGALGKLRSGEYVPGDVGFDPLGLYTGATADKQRDLELKELNNGRLAMMAVAGYVAQEFFANAPVA